MQIGRIRLGRRRLLAVAGLVVVTAVFVGAIPFGLDRNTAVSGVLGSVVLVVLAGLYVDQRRRHAALTSLVQQTRGAVLSQVDNVASRVEAVERSATQGAADNRTAIEETKRWMEARSQAMWDYFARGFHREPDTFVLYRIIGNDLPPRHRAGQTLTNLRFILEHEPELPHCEKRWVVNRIVDPEVEKQIIELLERHGARYLHIPFREEEYRKVGWRFNEFDPPRVHLPAGVRQARTAAALPGARPRLPQQEPLRDEQQRRPQRRLAGGPDGGEVGAPVGRQLLRHP